MPGENHEKRTMWFGVGKQIISFVVGVIAAAFVLGSARQRVSDLTTWKNEIAPKIDRMDSKGTLSFEHFEKSYYKEQHRNEERLKALEDEVKALQKEDKTP